MLRVFVGSPYKAYGSEERKRNDWYARRLCRIIAMQGHAPLAPHLSTPQFLVDGDHDEREIGLGIGKEWLKVSHLAMFGVDFGTSDGMKGEIAACCKYGTPYRCAVEEYFLSEFLKLEDMYREG